LFFFFLVDCIRERVRKIRQLLAASSCVDTSSVPSFESRERRSLRIFPVPASCCRYNCRIEIRLLYVRIRKTDSNVEYRIFVKICELLRAPRQYPSTQCTLGHDMPVWIIAPASHSLPSGPPNSITSGSASVSSS